MEEYRLLANPFYHIAFLKYHILCPIFSLDIQGWLHYIFPSKKQCLIFFLVNLTFQVPFG